MTASGKIEVAQGNTWGPFEPTLRYSDGTAYELPVGAIVLFTVKRSTDKSSDDSYALIKKDWSSGSWGLTAEDTEIPVGVYDYDVKVIAGGSELNSASGQFIVRRRITIRDTNA